MLGHSVVAHHINMSRYMRCIFDSFMKISVKFLSTIADLELKGYANSSNSIIHLQADNFDYFTRLINKYYPDSKVFQSLNPEELQTGFLFIPIDGVKNMEFSISNAGMFAAYVSQGKIKEVAYFDPIHRDFFWSTPDQDIYVNNFKIPLRLRMLTNKVIFCHNNSQSNLLLEKVRDNILRKYYNMYSEPMDPENLISRDFGTVILSLFNVIIGKHSLSLIQNTNYTIDKIATFLAAISKYHFCHSEKNGKYNIILSNISLGFNFQDLENNS